ncbi:hypothetical protein [Halorubrum trueperi]|uniref:Uncharacterized protein n=1 Tax=Halorubrum trueperi TaxID=2004704 RepID=A0ABD5UK43_9EURY
MPDQQFHDSVVAAGRWSKVVALFAAIGVFLVAGHLLGDAQAASIVAAAAGIGTRLYIPYHASIRVPEAERKPLRDHPTAGNYHHGAAGLALVAASLVSLFASLVRHGFLTGVVIGGISGVLGYVVFARLLPSE